MVVKKLRAATLVETLTAATILSIVGGLAIMVFLRLSTPASNGSTLLSAAQQSYAMIERDVFCTKEGRDENREIGNLLYAKTGVQRHRDLKQYEVAVFDVRGKLVYTRKRLYYER